MRCKDHSQKPESEDQWKSIDQSEGIIECVLTNERKVQGVLTNAMRGKSYLGHDEGRVAQLVSLAVVGAIVPRPVPL